MVTGDELDALPPVLAHQVEPEVAGRLRLFAELFCPGLTAWENPYARHTWLDLEGLGWRYRKRINLWRALCVHVAAGASGEAERYADEREMLIRAVGVAVQPETEVHVLQLDLDGGTYAPAGVVAALQLAVGRGRFLITTGSGRYPGHFRLLLPIEPLPMRDMQIHAGRLLGALGYEPKPGGLEVYPSTRNNRLPFGCGGCLVFEPGELAGPGLRLHPYALLDRLTALPRVDLAALVPPPTSPASMPLRPRPALEAAAAAEPAVMSAEECAAAARAALAALGPPAASPATSPAAQRSSPRPSSSTASASERTARQLAELVAAPAPDPRQRPERSTHCGPLWVHGVTGFGQRDAALTQLCADSLYRRRSPARAIQKIQEWIAKGGIARSKAVLVKGQLQHWIDDVPRRVKGVYRAFPCGRPKPVHLSPREVAEMRALAERAAVASGWEATKIGELLRQVLPYFKACAWAGLPATRMHCREWAALGGGDDYAQIRSAAGCFVAVSGYVSQWWLRRHRKNPADARAMDWTFNAFAFDPRDMKAPRRALGGSYGAAKLAAELAQARATKRAAARRVDRPPTESSIRMDRASSTDNRHTKSALGGAALPSLVERADPGSLGDRPPDRPPVTGPISPLPDPVPEIVTGDRAPGQDHGSGEIPPLPSPLPSPTDRQREPPPRAGAPAAAAGGGAPVTGGTPSGSASSRGRLPRPVQIPLPLRPRRAGPSRRRRRREHDPDP